MTNGPHHVKTHTEWTSCRLCLLHVSQKSDLNVFKPLGKTGGRNKK